MIGPEFEPRLVERVHGAAPPTRPHGSRNFVLRRSSRRTGRTGRWNSAEHLGPGPGGTPWTGSGQGPERRGAPHRPDPDRRWKWPFPPPPRSGSIAEAPGAPGGDGMAPWTRQDGSIVRPSPFPSSGATPPRRPTRRERSNSDGAGRMRRRIFRGGTPGTRGAAAARGPTGPPRYLEGGPGASLDQLRIECGSSASTWRGVLIPLTLLGYLFMLRLLSFARWILRADLPNGPTRIWIRNLRSNAFEPSRRWRFDESQGARRAGRRGTAGFRGLGARSERVSPSAGGSVSARRAGSRLKCGFASVPEMPDGIHHVDLPMLEFEETERFYSRVLGWTVTGRDPPNLLEVGAGGGAYLAFIRRSEPRYIGDEPHIAFKVTPQEQRRLLRSLRRFGVGYEVNRGENVAFYDPSGLRIELYRKRDRSG